MANPIESREIFDLTPDLVILYHQFMDKLQKEGSGKEYWGGLLVTCTYRSNEKQEQLYNQGRTTPGNIVTNAKPGQSEHNKVNEMGLPSSTAFDVVPVIPGKKGAESLDWSPSSLRWKLVREVWESGIQIKTEHGVAYLDWYGRQGAPFKELPHFCIKYRKPSLNSI